ncbi:MAG: 30S ribosomal protein S19 [archaeon]|jgi:small subunit ribosomal protein S19
MVQKEFTYRGKTMKEIEKMDLQEFMKMIPSRQRRSLKRGFTDAQKRLLAKIKKAKEGGTRKIIKTQCRNMIVIPEMVGITIHVHKGREYVPVPIVPEMLGHYLSEMTMTRQKVQHSAPGIGATKSSGAMSVK